MFFGLGWQEWGSCTFVTSNTGPGSSVVDESHPGNVVHHHQMSWWILLVLKVGTVPVWFWLVGC